jgi:hypothetical protein
LGLFDVLHPTTVSSCFHKGSNEALLCSLVAFDFHSIDIHGGEYIDVIKLNLDILLEMIELLLIALLGILFFFLFLLLSLFFSIDIPGSQKILEDLGVFGSSDALIFHFVFI